jgi:glyoxylase-like metal-dependent hydrolase (beta-lactamase superfamily II)
MREIVPGVHVWSWFCDEKGLDFNGTYVTGPGGPMLVDPPPFGPGDAEEIERRGAPTTIVVTNRHHLRRSVECRERFGARLLLPAADAAAIAAVPDGLYSPGDALPCGFTAIAVRDSKSPGETALHDPARRVLLVGDAVLGKPAGELSFLPDDKFASPGKAREGVRSLMALDFTALLVGDGAPILEGAKAALDRALAR